MSLVTKQAPWFSLAGVSEGQFITWDLAQMKGTWTVLFFYPLDFTFVCPTEIKEFSKRVAEFKQLGADVVSVSVDSKFSHLAWQEQALGKIAYPMLSDITKRVSRQYGVLIKSEGVALRGLFIIDPEGMVRYELIHELNVGRSVDETLRVLAALQTGELCPIDWEPGQATLGKG